MLFDCIAENMLQQDRHKNMQLLGGIFLFLAAKFSDLPSFSLVFFFGSYTFTRKVMVLEPDAIQLQHFHQFLREPMYQQSNQLFHLVHLICFFI